ncbi:MAG: hypothetical protein V1701_06290 [Planctomycetota bacterium]
MVCPRRKKDAADKKALAEYAQYNKTQLVESDFEKEVKKLLKDTGK